MELPYHQPLLFNAFVAYASKGGELKLLGSQLYFNMKFLTFRHLPTRISELECQPLKQGRGKGQRLCPFARILHQPLQLRCPGMQTHQQADQYSSAIMSRTRADQPVKG